MPEIEVSLAEATAQQQASPARTQTGDQDTDTASSSYTSPPTVQANTTITPGAGTWLCIFSQNVFVDQAASAPPPALTAVQGAARIRANAVVVAASERRFGMSAQAGVTSPPGAFAPGNVLISIADCVFSFTRQALAAAQTFDITGESVLSPAPPTGIGGAVGVERNTSAEKSTV
jgi:hypothetical protein